MQRLWFRPLPLRHPLRYLASWFSRRRSRHHQNELRRLSPRPSRHQKPRNQSSRPRLGPPARGLKSAPVKSMARALNGTPARSRRVAWLRPRRARARRKSQSRDANRRRHECAAQRHVVADSRKQQPAAPGPRSGLFCLKRLATASWSRV